MVPVFLWQSSFFLLYKKEYQDSRRQERTSCQRRDHPASLRTCACFFRRQLKVRPGSGEYQGALVLFAAGLFRPLGCFYGQRSVFPVLWKDKAVGIGFRGLLLTAQISGERDPPGLTVPFL